MASWLEDVLASIKASGEGAVNLGPPTTEREREMQALVKGGGYGSPDASNPGIRLALGDGLAPFGSAAIPAPTAAPRADGLGNPALSFPTGPVGPQPDISMMANPAEWSPFGPAPTVAPGAPPQMAAQTPIPGLNSPMGGGGAPFSIAGSPSLIAAKEMTAPPPMTQQAAVPGLVPPGSAPGVPGGPPAPPVVAQGDEEPAGAPTDVSAQRRAAAPASAPMGIAPDLPPPEPSFGDRLRAGGGALAAAMREASPGLIALGQGLSGGGWGTAAELAAARNKSDEAKALQAQQGNVTARLLASKGASPQEIAAAVAGGPDVVKALIGQYFAKDKFAVTQTGEVEDQYGGKRKVFKVFNANDGTFKDVPADTASEAKALASGDAPDLNDSQKNRVQAIIDGREPYPANSRAPDAAKIRAGVHAADPNFDAINYKSRETTRKNFTSGKAAGNVTAFNTAIGHLGTLYDSIDGLGNRSSPWYNRATQPISENLDPKYAASLKKFEAARTAVADELTRAFRGSGGNVHDIIQWEKTISTADSPQALKAAVQQAAELLNSRIVSLGDEYNRGMGTTKDPLELLNPKASAAFQHLLEGGRALAKSAAPVKPGNYVYRNGALVPE